MDDYITSVGLDVHKDFNTVALAPADGETAVYGRIENTPVAVEKLVRKLGQGGRRLRFCYEAGPCGYALYRQLRKLGQDCLVAAPSLIPTRPGDRVKTNRRDALNLARLLRAGELTGVWVPDERQESIRDVSRCRSDLRHHERLHRQRLGAFLLRYGQRYEGRRWTTAHLSWMQGLALPQGGQQVTLLTYLDGYQQAVRDREALEGQLPRLIADWDLLPLVHAYLAMRGVDLITAVTLACELGDITRFDSARQLMSYVGLTCAEHSTGHDVTRLGITKTGNAHVRRVLVESAWCYRHLPRVGARLKRRSQDTTEAVRQIAWKAQKRLCPRYRRLVQSGKRSVTAATAVAREMCGFLWAIAQEVKRSGLLPADPVAAR